MKRWRLKRLAVLVAVAHALAGFGSVPAALADDFLIFGGVTPSPPPEREGSAQAPVRHSSDQEPLVRAQLDPVDVQRGEFTLTRQDIFWPGRGLPVDVTFTYRSRNAYNGSFGYGWDMSYNRRVRKLSNNNVVVLRGNSRKDEFVSNQPGYTAPPGVYDTLVQNADGTYTLTSPHGDKEFYDVNGNLARLQDRNGNALTLTYDPAGLLPVLGRSDYFMNQATGVIAREYRLTRITDAVGRPVNFAYDADGRLVSITYAGRSVAYGYDAANTGDLVSVTTPTTPEFPSGNTTRYAYTTHRLETITDPQGQAYLVNGYDANGRLSSQNYGAGLSTVAYTLSDTCPSTPGSGQPGFSLALTPLTVAPGLPYTVNWQAPPDRAGHSMDWIGLFKVGDPNTTYGGVLYTSGQTSGTGSLFTSTRGTYEARYLLDGGYVDAARSNTACVGDAQALSVVTGADVTDRRGFQTHYEFDTAGHVTKTEQFTDGNPAGEPASYVTTYEYNAAGERTRILYPRGNAVEFSYDAKGNLLEIRRKKIGKPRGVPDATDVVTKFTYEPNFNFIKTITDPRLNVTTYTYDYELSEPMKGNLRRITYPTVGGVTPQAVFTYTSFGQVDTATDPTARATKYAYDAATGYLLQVTEGFGTPEAGTTAFGYDAVGNVTSVTDPRLNTTAFAYNALNQLTDMTAPSPFSFRTFYTYDANGNLLQVDRQATTTTPGARPAAGTVNPNDDWQSTVYTYTALDQLATVTDDLTNVTRFFYDEGGNRTSIIDAKLNTTAYTYDERNLLWKVTDAAGGVTEYRDDPNGNLASLTDAKNNATAYAYDDFDRLSQLTYPGSTHENYAYDPASNLTQRITPANQTITYVYDALNRLSQKTSPAETATYTYDAAGRLLTAANPAGTLTHAYDGQGRLKQAVFPGSQTVAYTYDAADNRATLAYPGGPTVTYPTYDQLNRLKAMTDLNGQTISFGYDALSRRASLTLPNGVVSTYGYDAANRLTSLIHTKGAATLSSFAYAYDPLGNRETRTDAAGTHAYNYDPLSQLVIADEQASGTPSLALTYDAVGNRLQVTRGSTTQAYTPNALNQYSAVGGTAQTSDANGNLTADGTATYTFDAENRLTQVVKGGVTTSFTYDALGRRASKTVSGVTTKFLYDGADLLEETNTAGTVQARYLYGPGIDEPLELKRGTTTSAYSTDGLGSITHLTTATGAIVETYTYETFGKLTIKNAAGTTLATSALGNRFTFTGREWDSETGLYYYRARYYHPGQGRFLSRDPLGYLPDVNLYRYVENDPTSRTDPFGLEAKQPTRDLKNAVEENIGFGSCCGASRQCNSGQAPPGSNAQQQACAVHDRALTQLNRRFQLTYEDYDRIIFDVARRPHKPVAEANRALLEASTNIFIRIYFGGRKSDTTTFRTPYPDLTPDLGGFNNIPNRWPIYHFYY